MIFVTVGTHQQPFDRLLEALGDDLGGGEVVVQHGPGEPPPDVERAVDFMDFDEMVEHFTAAETVVTHAGVGSILCAARLGHTPVVVPRRQDLGEHVDDHQCELTRALAAKGTVLPVWHTRELAEVVRRAPRRRERRALGDPGLALAVRKALRTPHRRRLLVR